MADGIETRIKISPEIERFLTSVMKHGNCDRSLKMKIRIGLMKEENRDYSLPYDVLTEAHEFYSDFTAHDSKDTMPLRSLVKSSEVYNESIPQPVRSPELQHRLAKLRREQEQKEYDRMVKNVKTKKRIPGEEVGEIVRTTRQQFMTVVNFLLSVAAAFAFGYVSSQYAFVNDFGGRLIFSIVLATVVALAELYFMARVEI